MQSVQKLTGGMLVLILMFFVFPLQMKVVDAEEYNSVKECLENPDACGGYVENPLEKSGEGEEIKSVNTIGLLWDFAKMILATIVVVAIIYLLFHYLSKKNREYQQTALIQNIGGLKVGTNRSVQMIRAGRRIFIIGVGENVNLLKELSGEEAEELLTQYNHYLDKLSKPEDIVSRLRYRLGGKREKEKLPFSSVLDKQFKEMDKERKQAYGELTKKGQRNDG